MWCPVLECAILFLTTVWSLVNVTSKSSGESRCNPVEYMVAVYYCTMSEHAELATACTAIPYSNTLPQAVKSSPTRHSLKPKNPHSLLPHSLKPPKQNPPTSVQIRRGGRRNVQSPTGCVKSVPKPVLGLAPSSSMKGTECPAPARTSELCAPTGGFDQCAVTSDFEIDDGDVNVTSKSSGESRCNPVEYMVLKNRQNQLRALQEGMGVFMPPRTEAEEDDLTKLLSGDATPDILKNLFNDCKEFLKRRSRTITIKKLEKRDDDITQELTETFSLF
ncbi:hypothetical protein K438DRAFT_1937237 [Mycena galopus ATCC 62051]|nr:hypothetical protein K438DRAFT_1937237 [Mycena galopus ATCC 62051]